MSPRGLIFCFQNTQNWMTCLMPIYLPLEGVMREDYNKNQTCHKQLVEMYSYSL